MASRKIEIWGLEQFPYRNSDELCLIAGADAFLSTGPEMHENQPFFFNGTAQRKHSLVVMNLEANSHCCHSFKPQHFMDLVTGRGPLGGWVYGEAFENTGVSRVKD